jgi:hypothetical protein
MDLSRRPDVFAAYRRLAAERQAIFFRRRRGKPPPWTDHRIMRTHKFLNAYHASDRVSQFLIRQVTSQPDLSAEDIVLRAVLFSRIETWRLLEAAHGRIEARFTPSAEPTGPPPPLVVRSTPNRSCTVPESSSESMNGTVAASCQIPPARPPRRAGPNGPRAATVRRRHRVANLPAPGDGLALSHPLEQRMSASFTSASLSLLGVIQGVALALLAAEVSAGYREFGVLEWLMTGVTALMLMVVWRHLSINAMAFNWRHSFGDVGLPFAIGGMEFFLCYAIAHGVEVWLIGAVFAVLCAVAEMCYVRWRAAHTPDSCLMLPFVRQRWRLQRSLNAAAIAVFPLLALASVVGWIDEAGGLPRVLAGGTILLVGAWLAGYALAGHLAWRAAVIPAGPTSGTGR